MVSLNGCRKRHKIPVDGNKEIIKKIKGFRMKNVVFYFSGTGNSLWTARITAQALGDCRIYPMAVARHRSEGVEADSVGLVFPVHMWGVPGLVLDFIRQLDVSPNTYLYAVAVNAGQVSRTLIQLQGEARKKGLTLAAGIDIKLPSNYIPWGGPGEEKEISQRITAAREKIETLCRRLRQREHWPVERGPLWQRILFTGLYKLAFKQVPVMDKKFFVDDGCNGCGICSRVCPVDNIMMEDSRPRWKGRCTQCLACIQWCPQKAIQLSSKTSGYERYHHPEILLKDVLFDNR